ncbi:WxL domain-containing protein [Vagococcus xieshaowenii]|nr:WxL domain-containing protein [Vagococcus xieshaowenii]
MDNLRKIMGCFGIGWLMLLSGWLGTCSVKAESLPSIQTAIAGLDGSQGAGLEQQGDWASNESNLYYGIGYSKDETIEETGATYRQGVPAINYFDPNDPEMKNPIKHMYSTLKNSNDPDSGYRYETTAGLNIFRVDRFNSSTYKTRAIYFGEGKITDEDTGEITAYANPSSGSKLKNINVWVVMKPNGDVIEHHFYIKNLTEAPLDVFPIKQVDTCLANDDDVAVCSRGPHKGMYIKNNQVGFRLDYQTDVPNGPAVYAASKYSIRMSDVFGSTPSAPKSKQVEQPRGAVLYGGTIDQDSGLFMSWGKKTIPAGSVIELRYDVGITKQFSKSYQNLCNNTEALIAANQNYIGDKLRYTVKLKSDEALTDINVSDILPAGLSTPEDMSLSINGNEQKLATENCYDEKTRTINIAQADLPLIEGDSYGEMLLSYTATPDRTTAGKTLTNTANYQATSTISGLNAGKANTNVLISSDLTANLLLKCVDTTGATIREDEALTFDLGEKYDITPPRIRGYSYQKIGKDSAALSGVFTRGLTVILVYEKKPATFELSQDVTDLTGQSLDKGTATQDQQMNYTVIIDSLRELEGDYQELTITSQLSEYLTDIRQVTLKDDANNKLNITQVYDETTHQLVVKLPKDQGVNALQNLTLTWQAKVKVDAPIDSEVKVTTTAKANYSDGVVSDEEKANELTTTVVAGELSFVEAPTAFQFGPQKVSVIDERYPVVKQEGRLRVQDLRGQGHQWQLFVQMTTPLMSNGEQLSSTLVYKKDNQLYDLSKSMLVENHETTDGGIVDMTKPFDEKEGLFLEVPAGLATVGNYQGALSWTLVNGPS